MFFTFIYRLVLNGATTYASRETGSILFESPSKALFNDIQHIKIGARIKKLLWFEVLLCRSQLFERGPEKRSYLYNGKSYEAGTRPIEFRTKFCIYNISMNEIYFSNFFPNLKFVWNDS